MDIHDKWFLRVFKTIWVLMIIWAAITLTFMGAVIYGLYLLYTGQLFP